MSAPVRVAINLQDWPGRGKPYVPPRRPRPARLGDRSGLIIAAGAERGADVEQLGLALALGIMGETVTNGWVIVPDDQPGIAELLGAWAHTNGVDTPAGQRSFAIVSATEFFDYRAGPFTSGVYTGRGWLVGANIPRLLGLVSERWVPARGRFDGGWSFYPPTWSEEIDRDNRGATVRSVSPHRPPIRARGVGAQGAIIEFSLPPRGMGVRDPSGRAFPGHFLDVLSAGFALDAIDSDHLADHLVVRGLPAIDMPAAVTMDAIGADQLREVVHAVHALAVQIDAEAATWLTSREERAQGLARLDIGRLTSPGSIAGALLGRAGIVPPLAKFAQPDDEALGRWTAAHHGGWQTAEMAGKGPFQATDIDLTAGYVQTAALVKWWRYETAADIREEDVTVAFRRFLEDANLARQILQPETWERWGLTLVELEPDGHELPVDVHGDQVTGRSTLRQVHSPIPLPYAWPDAVLTTLRTGRPPKVVRAARLVPVGKQTGLRAKVPILPGLVLDIDDDPAVALVRRRQAAKAIKDVRESTQLRVVVNGLIYGQPARLDQRPNGAERPGPWTWPPLAATVAAGTRLLIGLAELMLNEAGMTVAARDTDGLLLMASSSGGAMIPSDALDDVLSRFEALSPFGSDIPIWKVTRDKDGEPITAVVIGRKRYALGVRDGDSIHLVDATEHALGGVFVDPPILAGRDPNGRHRWTREVATRVLDEETGGRSGPLLPAEAGEFPALRRFQVGSTAALAQLPDELGVRPFGLYVEGLPDPLYGATTTPRALDPGTDLSDYRGLRWIGHHGQAERIATEPDAHAAVLWTLGGRARRWATSRTEIISDPVLVVPELIRRVGRLGTVVEASTGDPFGDHGSVRVVYDEGDAAAFIHDELTRLGPATLAERYDLPPDTAKKLRPGRQPSPATIRRVQAALRKAGTSRTCALDDCDAPLSRRNSLYCSKAHRERGYRLGQKSLRRPAPDPFVHVACIGCGTVLLGAAAHGPCPVCSTQNDKEMA
jgi:hypothetical protein